ncbi:MAG: hypothetical protein FWG79_09020 [Bacteroidales bacterium]|nr:hypothetical protein [Bacteroidales bacterium]
MKRITLILVILATFATKSFAYCPIPQWCPDAPLHQVLCPGEAINPIEFPSVIGKTLIINWWTDGTRFASINTPAGIIVSGPPENREHLSPVIIRGTPTTTGTHHYTVSNTCGVELLHGSITITTTPPTIGTVTPTSDQATPQNIPFANALTLTDDPIGMPPITIQWYSSTTPSSAAGASGTAVSGATGNTLAPPTNVANTAGIYYYAVATDRCGRTVTTNNTSGKHIVVPACIGTQGDLSLCTGTNYVPDIGVVNWQGSTNIETHARTISGNGITQVWSGVVTTSNCNSRATFTADDIVTNCRNATNGFNGDYFNFCFVIRYQATLCPSPWRVPTCQDFINLDIALGGNGYNREKGGTGDNAPTVNGHTLETQSRWYTDTWGGPPFTGHATSQENNPNSFYWSSSQANETAGFNLRLMPENSVEPQRFGGSKGSGLALRCVRDVP